ncbi:MAG: phenylalanine--tRNA ligase subunit beta [Erysipelotrichaceae bacterium]|nr:phenylalanine--tRNA ligase subunit beta [Erysipelotrichaceae bacterium]
MKVSKNWLKEYLDLNNITDEELFKEISFHICEIESYKKMVEATNLTIGHVLECVEHPDSDHLHVCQVEIKPGIISQIVCGAPNVCKGAKVIVALPGAVLPGDFKIKPAKVRGVESNGMLCSLQELGVDDKYIEERFKNGIYLLGDDANVGDDPLEYLGLDDYIIDLELTSNRSDLLSIEGVAYDLGATLNQKVMPIMPTIELSEKKNPVTVKVETDKCYKYNARYLANVKIEESPQWLKARLIASGIRPINNIVDITNFVLIEMGQPLHAFDADRLGNSIVVRQARDGEKIVTLDTIERTLTSDDMVITDGKKPVCLAGVMGGLDSEVENDTKNIVLEAAYFDPLCIRKTSSKLGLKSESSVRFEHKIDYDRVERAMDYAAQLMQEICGAEVYDGVSCDVKVVLEPKTVTVTADKINSTLGTDLSDEFVKEIFDRLDYTYAKNGKEYTITLPSRRMDLEPSAQDITEDVARIYGYDNIPTTIAKTRDKGALTYAQKRTRLIRQILANMGLNEAVSYSLISEKDLNLYTTEELAPVKVMMPMTEDRAVMRQSLLNGVIDAVKYNKARKLDNLAFYEIGKTYSTDKEETKLAIAITGLFSSHLWNGYKQEASFYVLKGILDALMVKLNVEGITYRACSDVKAFHPGRCASISLKGQEIGIIGQMHPKFAKDMGIGTTIALEISLEAILNTDNGLKYQPINKFPAIQRDLAIVCKKDIPAVDIQALIKQTGKKTLTKIELFDLYTGENVGEDEKSLAFKLTFEDPTKTLEAAEVDKLINSILNRLDYVYKAKLR